MKSCRVMSACSAGQSKREPRDGAVGFLLDGDFVEVLALALPLDPPDQEGSLQAEHEKLDKRRYGSDDEEVGVAGVEDGEPVVSRSPRRWTAC